MENICIVINLVLEPEVHKRHISGLLLFLSSLVLLTACSREHDASSLVPPKRDSVHILQDHPTMQLKAQAGWSTWRLDLKATSLI